MVVGLADNFYNGPLNVQDKRWATEFSSMYTFDAPFYTCMGNHDYAGSVNAQETFTTDARWHAGMNYTLTIPEADLSIVFVDSPRACASYMSAPYGDCNENCMLQLANISARGGGMSCTNATSVPCWESHVEWLNATLAGLTTKWKFVAGHHPITDEHMPLMAPSLGFHGVQAYLAGHVHNLQHAVATKGTPKPVNYFISGAGAFGSVAELEAAAAGLGSGRTHLPRSVSLPGEAAPEFEGNGPGFLSFTIDGDTAFASFILYNGTVVYSTNFTA